MFFSHLHAQNRSHEPCDDDHINKLSLLDVSSKQALKHQEQAFLLKRVAKSHNSKLSVNYVPLKVHIIRDADGFGGLSKLSIERAIDELNFIFKAAYINFYLFEDIDYINDDNLNHFKKGNENPLFDKYEEGVLNLYLADEVINASGSNICGYNLDNIDKNIIIMKNSCAVNGSSMAHEIGHFFSLLHTHGNANGKFPELVDGSNCDTNGDGICDTPADPGLSYDTVDENCEYIGQAKDANGDFYQPDTGNVMSYSRKSCRTHFTLQQYGRMYAYYVTVKENIFNAVEVSTTTTEGLENIVIYPNPVANGQIHIKRDQFLNETLYFEVANLSGQVLFKGITSNDLINIEKLSSGSYFLTLSNAETRITKRFVR
ncbi:hypothetical protein MHTCC0001_15580 [Flavobacteriaceae bacterium MHTCC 0001]